MSRYALEREAKIRAGIRLLLAAAVAVITWIIVSFAVFLGSGPWFTFPGLISPQRETPLLISAGVATLAACVLILGLLRGSVWRRAASAVWAGSALVTGFLLAFPTQRGTERSVSLLLATGALVGAFWYAQVKLDVPAT